MRWNSPTLPRGEYFWTAYIISDTDTNRSKTRTFALSNSSGKGFLAQSKQLQQFGNTNIYYSDNLKSLVLNTDLLPPRPSDAKLIDSVQVFLPPDTTALTSITTDGTFFYFGDLSYYRDDNKSRIYRVGTGDNGTIKGLLYGSIAELEIAIKNQIFYHSDGYIYAATGDDSSLLRIQPESGDTLRVIIPDKLLPTEDGLLKNGGILSGFRWKICLQLISRFWK